MGRAAAKEAPGWSETETWIWKQSCEGQICDLNTHFGELDPAEAQGWTDERVVSARFLQEILLQSPYQGQISGAGLRIRGALFREPIKLSVRRIAAELWLDYCRFEQAVDFSYAQMSGNLSFEGSVFLGADREFGCLSLTGAQVAGALALHKTKVTGPMWIANAKVDRDLELSAGVFASADLSGSQIGRRIVAVDVFFKGRLRLNEIRTGGQVFLGGSPGKLALFRGSVNISRASIGGDLMLQNFDLDDNLYIDSSEIGGDLVIQGRSKKFSTLKRLHLSSTRIKGAARLGQLAVTEKCVMADARFEQNLLLSGRLAKLEMLRAFVASDLTFTRGSANGVDLSGATVGGIYANGSFRFRGKLNLTAAQVNGQVVLIDLSSPTEFVMDGITITRDLFLRGELVRFGSLDLNAASVHGSVEITQAVSKGLLSMWGARFGKSVVISMDAAGPLNLYRIDVTGDLSMRGNFDRVILTSARIGSLLDLSGANFAQLDLSRSHIDGELRLCQDEAMPAPTGWRASTYAYQLDLSNSHARTLQDWAEWTALEKRWKSAWPEVGGVKLEGFTFDRFGGFGSGTSTAMLSRPWGWYTDWLGRNIPYSPQPYVELASVFRRHGHVSEADEILYEGRERARKSAHGWRWLGLTALMLTIGYGIGKRYFRALIWTAVLVALGGIVLVLADPANPALAGIAAKFAFSADKLLPFIKLDNSFDDVALDGGLRYYFYGHRILGFLIGSFLAAGLAGLTQK